MSKKIIKALFVFVLFVFTFTLVSCSDDTAMNLSPIINATGYHEVTVGSQIGITVEIVNGAKGNKDLKWTSTKPEVATVNNGVVTGVSEGDATITISYMNGRACANYDVKVVSGAATTLSFTEGYVELKAGETYQTAYTVTPAGALDVDYTSSNEKVATVLDTGLITVVGYGETEIKVKAKDVDAWSAMLVKVIDDVAPVVTFATEKDIRVGWNQTWDPLADITVTDNADGDITDRVEVLLNEVTKQYYGPCSVVYAVTDDAGNKLTFTRTITIYWPYSCMVIGHGLSYYGIMNTEEAAMNAIHYMHYPMLEVDVHRSKDGVFVCSHDGTIDGYKISENNWSTLKNCEFTGERGSGYPVQYGLTTHKTYTYKFYKLEDLLDLCKEYYTMLKIELKAAFSSSEMAELMKLIEDRDMLDLITFTAGSSMKGCLKWLREQGYKNEIQYLAWTCESQTTLDFCIEYNINVSICVTYGDYANSDAWIKKYKDAGLKLSCFTFQYCEDYPVVQKWIDKGADYVTCDWHDPSVLKLPLKAE